LGHGNHGRTHQWGRNSGGGSFAEETATAGFWRVGSCGCNVLLCWGHGMSPVERESVKKYQ
jgi:hypothetical protein